MALSLELAAVGAALLKTGPAEGSPQIEGDGGRQPVGGLSWTRAKL
jgi:hypothetical protein